MTKRRTRTSRTRQAPSSMAREPTDPAARRAWRRARSVVGETPARRAEWLLRFAAEDLDSLDEAERNTLKSELKFYILSLGDLRTYPLILRPEEIGECQEWLRDGLNALRIGSRWLIEYGFVPTYSVQLHPPGVSTRTPLHQPLIPFQEAVFRDSIPVLLKRLRFCPRPGCGRALLSRKRKTYCSGRCSQLQRSARFRGTHGERLRAERRKRYRRLMEKKLGHKVGSWRNGSE
jgi:hypothetical protein